MGRILTSLCIVIACCLSFASSMAGDVAQIGVIVDYSPPGASLYLERAGVKQPVRIATVVQAGDKIELPASAAVTVELADSRRLNPTGPGTWEAPDAPALGSIATFFHRVALVMEPDYRLTASAITRDVKLCKPAPIRVLVLPEGARVMAGERGLSLEWKGGCPPYRLELTSDHGVLGVQSDLKTSEYRFEHVTLNPGAYAVSISDRAGTSVTVPFTARSERPAWPDALTSDTTHLGTVARALWLADVDQGVWRLDSGELLLPLRRQHDPLAEAVWANILAQAAADPSAAR
jgi:hypothetical protein